MISTSPGPWAAKTGHRQGQSRAEPHLQSKGLSKSDGDHLRFTGLDVAIASWQRLSLTGPSGCGKTTLGGILLKLVRPDRGEVQHHSDPAGGRVQKLYQDPTVAFASRVPLRTSLRDVIRRHRVDPARVEVLLERCWSRGEARQACPIGKTMQQPWQPCERTGANRCR